MHLTLHCRHNGHDDLLDQASRNRGACLIDKSGRWKWMHGRKRDRDELRMRQPPLPDIGGCRPRLQRPLARGDLDTSRRQGRSFGGCEGEQAEGVAERAGSRAEERQADAGPARGGADEPRESTGEARATAGRPERASRRAEIGAGLARSRASLARGPGHTAASRARSTRSRGSRSCRAGPYTRTPPDLPPRQRAANREVVATVTNPDRIDR